MNSSSNNQPRPAAVEQGALPALPDWCYRDDLGGLVPSEIRAALNEHARAAWNMGLDVGLLHAPAVTDTGLPELRDHLATAKVMDRSITLSPAAAGALHKAMNTPAPRDEPGAFALGMLAEYEQLSKLPAPQLGGARHVVLEKGATDKLLQKLKTEAQALAADGANLSMDVGCMFVLAMIERIESRATAPQVAGYIEPQEIPCIGQCRTTLWATKQSPGAMAVYLPAPAAPATTDVCAEMRALCNSCGGTGDVTRIDGEWLGYCNCGSAK